MKEQRAPKSPDLGTLLRNYMLSNISRDRLILLYALIAEGGVSYLRGNGPTNLKTTHNLQLDFLIGVRF